MNLQGFFTVAPARERGLKYYLSRSNLLFPSVAPARERGLKFLTIIVELLVLMVAPARERGLKCDEWQKENLNKKSLPRGSVD